MFRSFMTSLLRGMVVAVALVATTAAYGQQSHRDFDLGRASEILVNMLRELERG